jgi:hypothetical protein
MNKAKFQIQVMKAVIAMKRKQAREMKDGPKKKQLLLNISTAMKVLNMMARKV